MAWEITPRESDLSRNDDSISIWSELTVVERYVSNGPPRWVLKGPSEQLGVFTPGTGCILDRDGIFVASGQARALQRAYEPDEQTGVLTDTTTVGFIGDSDDLWSRLCWPDPTHPLTATGSAFTPAYDTRTGARETTILGYIADNLGPAAPITSRRLPSLLLPSTLGRGGSTTAKARMDVLGELVAKLAESGNLDVRVVHDEDTGTPRLKVVIDEVEDVSENVVFGSADSARASGIISGWNYSMQAPEVTDAIVFAAGEQASRMGARFVDEAAVTRWARRRERLVDQWTDDAAAIADAAANALENGASPVSIPFDARDAGDAVYRETYHLGSLVGVELPGLPLDIADSRVREVVTVARPNQADRQTVTIGSPGATSIEPPSAKRMNKALRELAAIQRSR
jgi:hypothetical protein